MYINKEILTSYGIPTTYHALNAIHTYYDLGITHIDVAGYFSKEAHDSGSVAVVVNQVEVSKTSFVDEKDIYNSVIESSSIFNDGILCE